MSRNRVKQETRQAAKELGEKIRVLRKALGLSQIELSKKIVVPQTTISSWELGRNIPTAFELFRIAEFFDKPLEYFKPEARIEPDPPEQTELHQLKQRISQLEKIISEKVGIGK